MSTAAAKRRLLASRIAVLIVACVSSYFVLDTLGTMFIPAGSFGIDVIGETAIVDAIDPQSGSKGLRVGDRIDLGAMPFRERSYVYANTLLPVGLTLTVPIIRSGSKRSAIIRTFKSEFGIDDEIRYFARKIVAMAYIFVAVVLVWSRPNLMLWGLAIFLMRQHPWFITPFDSAPLAALSIAAWYTIYSLGWPGLIVFASRFPDNRTTRFTKYWDLFAAAIFVCHFSGSVRYFLPLFMARPIGVLPEWSSNVYAVIPVAIFAILCVKVFRTRALPATRIFRWVVAGYGVGVLVGWIALNEILWYYPVASAWLEFAQPIFMLALPLSVAYAVIRYRAFDLGFLANRTLVYGAFLVAAVSTIVIAVWAVSQRLTSTIDIRVATLAALLIGMTFQASRAFVERFVDRVFLRRRYDAAASLDMLRERLRGSRDAKRVTDEVASTLGLASLAVFSRAADGGFVREAAFGWPPGSAWHLLPEEALTRTLQEGAAIAAVTDDFYDDLALPSDARPRFALALRRGNRVTQAILVGPQRSGPNLDRDAMRSLRTVFDEAIFA